LGSNGCLTVPRTLPYSGEPRGDTSGSNVRAKQIGWFIAVYFRLLWI
jgi:hypothetical protein